MTYVRLKERGKVQDFWQSKDLRDCLLEGDKRKGKGGSEKARIKKKQMLEEDASKY